MLCRYVDMALNITEEQVLWNHGTNNCTKHSKNTKVVVKLVVKYWRFSRKSGMSCLPAESN